MKPEPQKGHKKKGRIGAGSALTSHVGALRLRASRLSNLRLRSRKRSDRDSQPRLGPSGHRDDLQGLRAVAVILVVLDHGGVGFLRGGYVGVDVFFVLSGFLITGLLLKAAAKRGFASLIDFYIRRARRILPAAALTLLVTDIAAFHFLNFVRAKQVMWDSIAASFFTANIHFANQATDYFARDQPPSPVQHYWSLAVEEQFYLVWPVVLALVLLGAVLSCRSRRQSPISNHTRIVTEAAIRRLLVVIVVIGAASLAWSVYDTNSSPTAAYFSTFARAWELALGAALAVASSRLIGVSAASRTVIGWMGLIGIACAAVLFSANTPFPGYAALLPTVGAVLVIGAGIGDQPRFGAGRLLALPPMRYVGDRSYAFYLWHWPVLIIALEYEGHNLSVGVNMILLLGAFLLSIVSYGLFENPIRRARWTAPRTALLWPASIAAVVLVAAVGLRALDAKSVRLEIASAAVNTGSSRGAATSKALPSVIAAVKAARRGASIPSALTPPIDSLLTDYYDPGSCASHNGQTTSDICRVGDKSATRLIVVMGDSHAYMWMPAILQMAEEDGWAVVLLGKSACTPDGWIRLRSDPHSPSWAECRAWYGWVVQQVKALKPTVTVVTGRYNTSDATRVKAIVSAATTMKKFSKAVVVIGDPPSQARQPVDCLLAAHATMKTCTTLVPKKRWQVYEKIAAGVKKHHAAFLDTMGWFCYQYLCPTVVGNTIVNRDTEHLSKTYAVKLPFGPAFNRGIVNQIFK